SRLDAFVFTSLAVLIISYPLDVCVPGNYGTKYSTGFFLCGLALPIGLIVKGRLYYQLIEK
ncbi:MAG: hypothetical protein E6Y37_17550, partial [Enterobacter hormaechei]|nr:hypothetical protein [Enterobacter hormaechei]